jgi:cellulose synthase/poly-beta-1,6-N-acetylglucosamine synthase-like glycosyltransferase
MVHSILALCYAIALVIPVAWGTMCLVLTWRSRRGSQQPRPVPPYEGTWPMVTVQIPVYNERYVVDRVIAAVAALDYPRDAIEVQVLDDSSDDTSDIVHQAVVHAQGLGLAIQHIRRSDRSGFKAGAMNAALKIAQGDFIAIFDADFVPSADFLRRTVPFLVDDATLGCVQARWEHLNGDESLLTRAQRVWLDGQLLVEQTGRSHAGLPVAFLGSAGVWRRTAIIEQGGWHTDTQLEDHDQSYRAQIAGWRILILPDLAVPAELPSHIDAFRVQQYRWSKGMSQVLRKVGVPLWRSRLPLLAKLAGTLHLLGYMAHVMLMILMLVQLPLSLLGVSLGWLTIPALVASAGPLVMYASSERRIRGSWRTVLRHVPLLVVLWMGLSVTIARGAGEGLLSRTCQWPRTPKFGGRRPSSMRAFTHVHVHEVVWIELAVALAALVGCAIALIRYEYATALFLAAFGVSVSLIAGTSIMSLCKPHGTARVFQDAEWRGEDLQPALETRPARTIVGDSLRHRG